jgi:GH24 family phage-related lysozyme (muramidase)
MSTVAVETGLFAAVIPVLLRHEGEKLHVYPDSLGIPTVGVGLALMYKDANGNLVPSPYAQSLCRRCDVDYEDVLAGKVDITKAQSRHLLSLCIIDVMNWLTVLFPLFGTYTQPRQIGLVDMGFELGESKFRGFKETISCILAGNWVLASENALHSAWASEVPGRAEYDAGLLRAG